MFQRQTTLIVGAGCSYEYGLPVGDGLKNEIASQLAYIGKKYRSGGHSGITVISSKGADEVLASAIQYAGQIKGSRDWQIIANGMAEGVSQASSIDRYLHFHRHDPAKVAIGKLAIARAILTAEQNSLLENEGFDLNDIYAKREGRPHWLQQLFFRLQDDVSLAGLDKLFSNLTVITFNYDRVIEHYLFHAVKNLAGISARETADVMSRLKIIHPYGKIGRLPWQANDGTDPLPFGSYRDLTVDQVIQSGERLRTFTETIEDDEILGGIKGAINNSEQIVFLGFSFLQQNLDLLKANSRSRADVIEATCFKESESNIRTARRRIEAMLNGEERPVSGEYYVNFHNLPAGQYIQEFGNELAS